MEDEIEKTAKESTKAEHYTCPFVVLMSLKHM